MILCTGNPNHLTIASAVAKKFPSAEFASRATGYDLTFASEGSETHFRNNIKNYNIFINSSLIRNGRQLALLEVTYEEWSKNNIAGHIINIGSISEHMGTINIMPMNLYWALYSVHKRALRDRSLQLNTKSNIKTSHITAGGINDGKPGREQWLGVDVIADTIHWILNHPYNIPLIEIHPHVETRI